ncbi:Transmembrane protein 170A [Chionoecetes opilio]|uniref:Transmembrane protein 170A n=1 Tax=Chionoecetes opilio TaxID=41210 RepID=A0A8J5CLU1_CHIOP|nr:Transmembrane protein 170A [Chionoecetes opilio]
MLLLLWLLNFFQILECLTRTMSPKGWCGSACVAQVGAVILVLGGLGGEVVRQAEAVVAYSTQNQASLYLDDFTNRKLESFSELWQGIFLWGFFSILFIHIVSAIIAFLMLRRHKYGRFSAAVVLLVGMCTTFVMCVATSVVVGFVLYQAKITLQPIQAMMCGIAQTALLILFSLSKCRAPWQVLCHGLSVELHGRSCVMASSVELHGRCCVMASV